MKPAESKMREAILAAVKTGMSKGLKTADVVVAALTFAVNCAESYIIAAKPCKEDEVRAQLVKAIESMAQAVRDFKPPAKQNKEGSAWEQKR